MRTRRAKSRTTSRYANVIEHLESRYLLTDLVGGTPATATDLGTLTATQPFEIFGAIDAAFDLDVFRFQAGTQETATIELSANFSSLDTFVRLLDLSGNELAFDDDSGPGTDSLLRFTVNGGETYFVEAGDLFDGTGDFFLTITLDAGDTIGTATDLGTLTAAQPVEFQSAIDQAFDRDVFRFQAEDSGSVLVELSAAFGLLDPVVTVFDSAGTMIASNDDLDFFTSDSRLLFSAEQGEVYFVEARGFGSTFGEYVLRLTAVQDFVGDTIAMAEDLGLLTDAQPLEFLSAIEFPFDLDVFQFQADVSGSTVVELRAEFDVSSFDFLETFVTVLDFAGNVIAFNDDIDFDNFETDSRVIFQAEAGETYFVTAAGTAAGFDGSIGDYRLSIFYDFGFPPETATDLGLLTEEQPRQVLGEIEDFEFHDLFLFTAETSGTVEVRQTAQPVEGDALPFDGILQAFNVGSSFPIASDFGTFDTTVPRIVTFEVIAGQSYFVEVTGFDGSVGGYRLNLGYVADDVPAGTFQLLTFSGGSRVIEEPGSIEVSGDTDAYRLISDADQTLQISLAAAPGSFLDPVLQVVVTSDDGTTRTLENDDAGFTFGGFSYDGFLSIPNVGTGDVVEITARGFRATRGDYRLTITGVVGGVDATELVAGVPVSGNTEFPFSTDLFQFTADVNGMATIDVTSIDDPDLPLGEIFDPLVTIRETATGNFVAFDDDSGSGLNSLVTFRMDAEAQYDVIVGGFGSRTGNFQVTLSVAAGEGDDFGDSFGQAFPLSFGSDTTISRPGRISPNFTPADADVFLLANMEFSGTIRLSVDPDSADLRPGLSVFQASPTGSVTDVELLAVSEPGLAGQPTADLFVPILAGRTYFFRVVGLNNTFGNYELQVEQVADEVPGAPPGRSLDVEDGVPVTLQDPFEQRINAPFDRDWYRVVAPSQGEFTITLNQGSGNGLDPLLTIYNAQGLAIARNDNSGDSTLNSQLILQAPTSGEVFFVEAAGVNDSAGAYVLTVQFAAAVVAVNEIGDDPGHISELEPNDRGQLALASTLDDGNDRDFIGFTVAIGGTFTVQLTSGAAVPAGIQLQVFELEASEFSRASIDNLTRIASVTSAAGDAIFTLPEDDGTIVVQPSANDPDGTDRRFVVVVSQTGGDTVDYNLSIDVTPGTAAGAQSLVAAAQTALLALADGAAADGDANPNVINAALNTIISELAKLGDFLVVLIDPVIDPVLTDAQGRQSGFTSGNGTLNEVSGGYVSVGNFGQVLILPVSAVGSFNLSFSVAGVGLDTPATNFVSALVVRAGSTAPQMVSMGFEPSQGAGGRVNFVVQLGFGDTVIPNQGGVSGGQTPSFFMMTNVMSKDPPPSDTTTQTATSDSAIARADDRRDKNEPNSPAPFDLVFWLDVLEGVLQELQIEGLSRPTLDRVLQRLRENESKLPVELMKNASVVRSAKAMYEVLKNSTGWLRNTKPTTPPAPKQRTPMPKVTQETPVPKTASQARIASKKMTDLGG